MFKRFLVILFFTVVASSFYSTANASSTKPIWIMVRAGLLSPVSNYKNYDNNYTVGGVIGVQLSNFFGLEAGVDYAPWDSKKVIEGVKVEPNFTTIDIKAYLLLQPVIVVSNTFSILPHVGVGVIYSINDTIGDRVGYAVKAGIRLKVSLFMIGAFVEYADRKTRDVSYVGEVGVAF